MRKLWRSGFAVTLFLLGVANSFAQKETAHWFFNGSHALVTPSGISNTNPVAIASLFQPSYRTTSVSDAEGNLLFAADGQTIIDKNLQEMPAVRGVAMGGARKIMAIQIPNSNKYYLFYTKPANYDFGAMPCSLNYALIDLSLNNGNGDVTDIQTLDSAVSEAFTLVQSPTSGEAWLVTHKLGTTSFLSYKITAAGINTTPVTSNAGTVASIIDYAFVDLKTSPDGKMIGGICYRNHTTLFAETYQFAEVFNFDFATGNVSNRVRSFRRTGYFFNNFSVEFSPDNRLFYVCMVQRIPNLQIFTWAEGRVYQYNLCYTDSTDFDRFSMTVAHDFRPYAPQLSWGQMQLGADKKFYLPFSGTTVSGFNYPNIIGSYSGYQFDVHQLQGNNWATVATPNFEHRLLEKAVKNNIVYSGGCFPNTTEFKVTNDTIANIAWDFGDPSGSSNTSSLLRPAHLFSAPGFYTVKADLYSTEGQLIERLSQLVEIKDPAKRLLADYPKDTSFCDGEKLTLRLHAVNGVFHWSFKGWRPDTFHIQTADTLDITSGGTYFVELRQNDCNGCTMIDSIKVNVLPKPYLNLYNQNLCTGDSLRLQVYDGPDWTWSTGENTTSIWVHSGGHYWVRGEYDHNGCPNSDTVVITQVPGVQFALPNDTTLCNSANLLLNPGVSNAYYNWQDGTNSTTYTVTQSGTYWLRVSNAYFCTRSDTIRVSYVNAEQVYLGNDTTLCQGDSAILKTDIANANYLWSNGSVSNSITVKRAGTYWLTVNNGTCSVTDTISIGFQNPPQIHLGNDTALCENDRVILNAAAANASYLWSSGDRSDSLAVSEPGKYWVVVNQNGCVVKDSINISYKPLPVLSLGSDTSICANASIRLNASSPSIQSYLWQNGSVQPNLTASTEGSYWVRAMGADGCTNTDTIKIGIIPLPSFSLGSDTVLCEGKALFLQFVVAGANYHWNTGNTGNSLNIDQPGMYWLDVTQNGCTKRDSLLVNYKATPQVFLGNDTTLCEGTQKLLDATNANAVYHWQDGSTSATYLVSKPGTYSVVVDKSGCQRSDTIKLSYIDKPHFTLGRDTAICEGSELVLNPVLSNVSFLWQDGSTAPVFTVKDAGIYRLIAANICGSTADEIKVERGACQLWMPSAFTPNGDGLNDLFRVKSPGFIENFSMTIYNRWGEIVFQTKDPAKGWDGKYRGLEQQSDVFVWQISLTSKQGEKMSAKGTVMLIR